MGEDVTKQLSVQETQMLLLLHHHGKRWSMYESLLNKLWLKFDLGGHSLCSLRPSGSEAEQSVNVQRCAEMTHCESAWNHEGRFLRGWEENANMCANLKMCQLLIHTDRFLFNMCRFQGCLSNISSWENHLIHLFTSSLRFCARNSLCNYCFRGEYEQQKFTKVIQWSENFEIRNYIHNAWNVIRVGIINCSFSLHVFGPKQSTATTLNSMSICVYEHGLYVCFVVRILYFCYCFYYYYFTVHMRCE